MLIQVMVAGIISAIIALGITSMMTDSFKGMNNMEQNQAAYDLRSNANVLLSDQASCTRNFGSTGANITPSPSSLSASLVNASGTIVIDVGPSAPPLYNKARILSYTIQQVGPPLSTVPDYLVLAEMKMTMEKVGSGMGSSQISRSLMLTAKLSGVGGPIVDCIAGNSLNLNTAILANPGSASFPNGLIVKWGTFTVTNDGGGGYVAFVSPFPNGVFTVQVQSEGGNGNSQDNPATASGWNNNGFFWINARDNYPVTGTYFATGH